MYKKNIYVREDYQLINNMCKYRNVSFLHDIPLLLLPLKVAKTKEYENIEESLIDTVLTEEGKQFKQQMREKVLQRFMELYPHTTGLNTQTLQDDLADTFLLILNDLSTNEIQNAINRLHYLADKLDMDVNKISKFIHIEAVPIQDKLAEEIQPQSGSDVLANTHQLFFIIEEFPENRFLYHDPF